MKKSRTARLMCHVFAAALLWLCATSAVAQPFASGYVMQQQSPMYSFVGKKYVNVSAKGTDKKVKSFSQYVGKGKYVLIDFWASWCGPCMREMPVLKECYDKYHKRKGFDIVAFSLDDNTTDWQNAIRDANLTWHHMTDLKGFNSPAVNTYKLEYIPWNLLCDPKGNVIAVGLRGDELKEKLQSIYGY